MSLLTHGSDLSLAPMVRPIVEQSGRSLKNALTKLVKSGFTSVQLDATLSGIRPRELNVRARKDLSALLTRNSMSLAGIDLFIPVAHFTDPQQVDRAMGAALATIELAADLGRVPVSTALPVGELTDDVKSALVEAADGHNVRLAIHAEADATALADWLDEVDLPALGYGLDPAALITRNSNAIDAAHQRSERLTVARLSDAESDSATRCVIGQGELDVLGYRIALDLAKRRQGPVVLDLRGLSDPATAAVSALKTWQDAAFSV